MGVMRVERRAQRIRRGTHRKCDCQEGQGEAGGANGSSSRHAELSGWWAPKGQRPGARTPQTLGLGSETGTISVADAECNHKSPAHLFQAEKSPHATLQNLLVTTVKTSTTNSLVQKPISLALVCFSSLRCPLPPTPLPPPPPPPPSAFPLGRAHQLLSNTLLITSCLSPPSPTYVCTYVRLPLPQSASYLPLRMHFSALHFLLSFLLMVPTMWSPSKGPSHTRPTC